MAEKKSWFQKLTERPRKPYANPYVGGAILGVTLFLSLLLTANGLGASAMFARLNAFAIDLVAPHHVDQTPQLLKIAGGNRNPLDNWVTFEIIGVVLGALVAGIMGGRFKPEVTKGPRVSDRTRLILAFVGGAVFVYGARMARGCTSGQVLSGGATLSAGSWVIALVMFAVAYAAAFLLRKLWN